MVRAGLASVEHDNLLTIGLCNAGNEEVPVWLEPWCDEFVLPPRSELLLRVEADDGIVWEPELEITDDSLVIYGAGATRIRVLVDGIEQHTGSAILTPPAFGMSTRAFVDVVFGDHPAARPHGRSISRTVHWFKRLFGRA